MGKYFKLYYLSQRKNVNAGIKDVFYREKMPNTEITLSIYYTCSTNPFKVS